MGFPFSKTPIGRLRLAGFTEGISYLLLLFVAMPLKYMANIPEAVKIMGWIHGALFIWFVVALLNVMATQKWKIGKSFLAFLASLIPFGTFVLDVQLRKDESQISN
jgi:integral membrane protein